MKRKLEEWIGGLDYDPSYEEIEAVKAEKKEKAEEEIKTELEEHRKDLEAWMGLSE